nr:MAG TPA: hypothetical protein [Caudoviricetes sp.]
MQANALHYSMQHHHIRICLAIVLQEGPFC